MRSGIAGAITIAVVLVVLGVGAAAIGATSGSQPGTASAAAMAPAASAAAGGAPGASEVPLAPGAAGQPADDRPLVAALDSLVASGTITEAQKQAVLDAVRAQRVSRAQDRKAERTQLRQLLADGVITKDEFDQLPADSPLRQLSALMDDGQITLQELRGVRKDILRGLGGMNGTAGKGGRMNRGAGGVPNATASPAPTSGTSG